MKKNCVLAMAFIFIILVNSSCMTPSQSDFRKNLPEAGAGFHWEVFDEINVAVPAPDNWYRAVSKGSGTFTGSISLENYEKDGLFKTGFSIQVIYNVKNRTGSPPSIVAVAMGEEITNAPFNIVLRSDALKDHGSSRTCLIQYRNAPTLGNKITVHKFFVAIDKRDLLYIFTFESPTVTWDDSLSKYGAPMMAGITMAQ